MDDYGNAIEYAYFSQRMWLAKIRFFHTLH
jgi:hypothetical protein